MNLRGHAQNTTNPAISLVVYNVIPLLIGPLAPAPITSNRYHTDEETRPCSFPVTGKGDRWVNEPNGDQFSGRNFGVILNSDQLELWLHPLITTTELVTFGVRHPPGSVHRNGKPTRPNSL